MSEGAAEGAWTEEEGGAVIKTWIIILLLFIFTVKSKIKMM